MSPLLEISNDHLCFPSIPMLLPVSVDTLPKCSKALCFLKHLANWIINFYLFIFIHSKTMSSLKGKDYMSLSPYPQCLTQKMTQNWVECWINLQIIIVQKSRHPGHQPIQNWVPLLASKRKPIHNKYWYF